MWMLRYWGDGTTIPSSYFRYNEKQAAQRVNEEKESLTKPLNNIIAELEKEITNEI